MFPNQILDIVSQPDLGSQRLSALEMIHVLIHRDIRDSYTILPFGSVQKVKSIVFEFLTMNCAFFLDKMFVGRKVMLNPATPSE